MKKLWLLWFLALLLVFVAGCANKTQKNLEPETIDGNIVEVEGQENIEEEIVEEEIEEVIDWEKWNLLAFNWKEVDWNYSMVITNDGNLTTKFCNSIGWNISFDWDDNEWTISASLVQTEMACEWESMDLENAFKINWAEYSIMADEDGWSTMIIKTDAWDKFIWRMHIN